MGQSNLLTYGRRLHDIGRVVVEAVYEAGGNDEDAERIFNGVLCRQIGQLVMGKLKLALHPCQLLASGLIPTKWEIIEDVAPTDFKVSDLKMVSFQEGDESCVNGEVMRKRAVGLKANLGLADAKRLLDNQSEIPIEFRGKYLVVPGTLLRYPGGFLHVAYLYWHDDRWCLHFSWLDHDWYDGHRLLRCK